MRDPYTSQSEGGHPDSISPAQISVPDTMLSPFTGKQPGRSYALPFAIGVCAIGGALLIGYQVMAPPAPGTVVMNTRPADVNVTLDGKSLGMRTSPLKLDALAPEVEHVIEISREGFKPQTHRVKLEAGQVQDLQVVSLEQLVVETGFALDSIPTGSTVLIDGKPLAQVTPVKVTDLAPGPHTIRVEHGFTHRPWEMPFTANPGEVIQIPAPTLVPLTPAEAKKAERAAKLQALKDAKAAKAAAAKAKAKPTPAAPSPQEAAADQ